MSSTPVPGPLPPDVNRGSDLVIISWLTVSIALLLVSVRFYIRGILRKNLGWDDYLILLAIIFAIAQSVFSTLQVQSGLGRNIQYLSQVQLQHFDLYTNIYILLHIVGTGLARISVCLFVLRLVPTTEISYRRWISGVLALNTVVSLADFLAFCFQCIPVSRLWDQSVKSLCFARADMTKIAQFQGGSAVVTDLLCVLLPILVFRTLQASLRDKVAVFLVLALGLFTAAAAIARTSLVDLERKDPTRNSLSIGIWACLEQNVGIAVASLPAIRQFLTIRKKQHASHTSEPVCNHNSNTRPPLNAFPGLSHNDRIRLPNDAYSAETTSRDFSTPTPKTADIESCHDRRASLVRPGTASPPLWIDRKISSAETVEMSRVSPRKLSTAETLRLSMVTPSWEGHSKSSSSSSSSSSAVDKAHNNNNNNKRLSMVSPLTVDRPPPLFSAGRKQHLGRFEETGLRNSRIATPEEMMMLGNPAAMGYSCKVEGATSKTLPKFPPS